MTHWTFVLRSLRYHARAHLGTLLGAAVGSAVLIGALVVGDSVRGSLREFALARLGKIQSALPANDRFFRTALADELSQPGLIEGIVAPAVQLPASVRVADGSGRANRVQLLGVDERFWRLSERTPGFATPGADEVVLNERLARQLKTKIGDTLLMRVSKPTLLSRDAPLTPQEDSSVSLRLTVRAVASDAELGRFSLQANQIPPFNAFVSLAALQQRLSLPGRANLLLAATGDDRLATVQANRAVRQTWKLADAELELRALPGLDGLELRSRRVFLDPVVVQAARRISTNASAILVYFVSELRVGSRATPYSMVAAVSDMIVPRDMGDDEILINQWLADDLEAHSGDRLSLRYYIVGTSRKLEERTNQFVVRAVIPLSGAAADPTLMPDFPGLEKAESTRDWDSSLPIKIENIRPKDEEYWRTFRGTPKAFITLAAGQALWSNRFGNLTAVRYPMPEQTASTPPKNSSAKAADGVERVPASTNASQRVEKELWSKIDPGSLGLRFQPVRQQALAASSQAFDFGQLFLGFSLFLIVAALLLMALLFQFALEKRAVEIGILLAVGFRPRQVRRLLLFEGCGLALLGGLLGMAGGIGYARAMVHGLSTVWRDAIARSALHFYVEFQTLLAGALAGAVVASLTIWLALRKQARQPARELLAEGAEQEGRDPRAQTSGWLGFSAAFIGVLAILVALALIGWTISRKDTAAAGPFFGAGALLLVGGLSLSAALLGWRRRARPATRLSLGGLGFRNVARRPKRSLATLGLLACGSFLIAAIGAFRQEAHQDPTLRFTGTGGFGLLGETTLPVIEDLNTKGGREFFGLDEEALVETRFVPMRVRDGDDASCLNLNRAQTPRLLGVDPKLLASRHAFTFAKVAAGLPRENPWLLLDFTTSQEPRPSDDAIPAIADAASIEWALGKKVGDTLSYLDERGRRFQVRIVAALANSVLQGSLVISEGNFVARFPGEPGYRMFLIDAPSNRWPAVSDALSRGLQDVGLDLIPATQRLAEFNAVQNTYLSTFQLLGGLGLLLGSVGLGVVVLRNVLERRGELAVLLAVGFRPRGLRWLVLSEHGALLLSGLGLGVLAALVAVIPALLSPGARLPYGSLSWTLLAVLANGFFWTWLAAVIALRGKIIEALRDE
jgi:putative ABC transport system permease protein